MKGYTRPVLLVTLILLADQLLKFWVKLHMNMGQEFHIAGNWFLIHFTENNGMAFGMELGGTSGKLFLTLFRIVAVCGIGYGVVHLVKKKYHRSLTLNVSMIFAGALGNIIDSTFYGLLFSESSYFEPAKLLPQGGGYAGIFHGKVVDMFYFPLLQGTFPSWVPVWGGEEFIFFRPVFNVADAAISIGVILILIFQKRYFKEERKEEPSYHSEVVEE
ncbi:lipoprotein signal peptidase [Hufsiella ginkgonis]|uniref:Lipoprotein signal peptidase n=1 Tax=Hufsiella ginkgonis TaxID=2695274 RepID=A0A7K1Y1X9_9SPHI|nr:lipoprotein signal peptidase [Hufsiella ginkgonis]MXV17283.1 lipoprotein signal peptidase [Hufsiella ginkgonis]